MAVITSTLMYGGKNKVGTVVVKTVRGQLVLSQYQPHVLNPRSAGQTEQRARMKAIVPLWKSVQTVGEFAIQEKLNKQSRYNKFVQMNIINATNYANGIALVDWQELQVSHGSLAPVQYMSFGEAGNTLTFTYNGAVTAGTENGSDEIYIGIVSPASYDSQLLFVSRRDTNGSASVTLPSFPTGTLAYIYMFTINPITRRGSMTQFIDSHTYV